MCWRNKKKSKIIYPNCSVCKKNPIKYKRELNLNLVPNEYILSIDDTCAQILIVSYGMDYSKDKINFVNLPKELVMTKYDYKLCEECYGGHIIKKVSDYSEYYNFKEHFVNGDFTWTEWTKLY
jgi:hypothetical protein